jgi:TetR/AcrR family transcriptional regulator, cholesterol catabolism regulator
MKAAGIAVAGNAKLVELSQPIGNGPKVVSTAIQQQRRERIVLAALDLAADGYDAVHMRSVADRAGVAASTVYGYFSSKDDLLLSCLHHWLADYAAMTETSPGEFTDPYQQLLERIGHLTEDLCAVPQLADAVARAYLCADGSAVANAALVRNSLSQIFADAITDKPRTPHHQQVGELITDIWAANILAIVQKRHSVDDLLRRLTCAVRAIGDQDLKLHAGP